METVDADDFEETLDLDNVPDPYREFRDEEEIPVHRGLSVADLNALETGDWTRTGQRGAFVNLYGAEGVNDMQIHELKPGGKTHRCQHRYDQIVYVSRGQGITHVGEGETATFFEWTENSLFFLPPNTPYRHVNVSEDDSARLVAETPLPQLFNIYRDADLLVESDESWWDRYRGDALYAPEATLRVVGEDSDEKVPGVPSGTVYWSANFVPDVRQFDRLDENALRGAGGTSVIFPMRESGMYAHISEFPVGRYKKAHRHHPGANVSILSGEGFSLLWNETHDARIRIDWRPGTVLTPPARWYHQHFNTGDEPARYFAMHGVSFGSLEDGGTFDATRPDNQIEYHQEDPDVREYYRAELAGRGVEMDMPDGAYEDAGYEFEKAV